MVPSNVSAAKKEKLKHDLLKKLAKCKAKIAEYTSEPFIQKIRPARVFVTFQNQSSVAKCLNDMKVGRTPFGVNPLAAPNPACRFDYRGRPSQVPVPELWVAEAPEPSEIVWEHLGNEFSNLVCQFMATSALTGLFLLFDYKLLMWLHRIKAPRKMTSLFVTLFNVGAPKIMKALTNGMEHHVYEGTHEASLL